MGVKETAVEDMVHAFEGMTLAFQEATLRIALLTITVNSESYENSMVFFSGDTGINVLFQ